MPKPDPERISLARRAAILSRLTISGMSLDPAEAIASALGATGHPPPRWSGCLHGLGEGVLTPTAGQLQCPRPERVTIADTADGIVAWSTTTLEPR